MTATATAAQVLYDTWADPFKDAVKAYEVGREVLTLPAGATVSGSWTPKLTVVDTAEDAFTATGQFQATLTGDGKPVTRTGWCQCAEPVPAVDNGWVYYEAWSARGREAHGWACVTCRRLTQTG